MSDFAFEPGEVPISGKAPNGDDRAPASPKDSEPKVIGDAPAFRHVLRMLDRVAPTDRPVLISGPTGSGKELMAHLVHHRGRGIRSPFVDVNCGALPEHLVEAELFGYAKGAFTGAVASHPGHFERVGEGTLFLDEIGELPMALQPKLLRVLETRTFRPVGSTETKRFAGRIVAASHRDLQALVHEGRFREDLYFRLAVFILDIPGLDQRREDIATLVDHFASLQPRPITLTSDAMERLVNSDWPGNVRQLRNLVDRLGVLAEEPRITSDVLSEFMTTPGVLTGPVSTLADSLLALPGEDKLAAAEQLMLDRAMHLSSGNKTAAARLLGISRKAVERRMQGRVSKYERVEQCMDEAKALVGKAAFREAIPLLRRGLELLDASAQQPDSQRKRFDLHRQMGICLRSVEGWLSEEAKKSYEAAFKAGQGLADERELTSLLFGIWTTELMTMDLSKARGTVQEMLQRAQASGDADTSAEAHVAMANTLYWLGDSAEALACLHRGGLVPVGTQERSGTQGFDLVGLGLNFEGLAAFQIGDFTRAKQARDRLERRSRERLQHPLNQAIALQGAAWLACLFEDIAALGPLAKELESLSANHGLVFYQGVGEIFHGVWLTAQSRFAEAEKAIREGFETHMLKNGGKLFYSFQAWKMGELLLKSGRPTESERLMAQSIDVVLEHQDKAYLGELLDVQARARMAAGDLEGAEDGFREALSTAVALGATPARLCAATHLAELLVKTGRVALARELLSKTLKLFGPDQSCASLIRARDLRRRLDFAQ